MFRITRAQQGNTLYRGYVGILIPYCLLSTSKNMFYGIPGANARLMSLSHFMRGCQKSRDSDYYRGY